MITNPDPRGLMSIVSRLPRVVQYHDVVSRIQRDMGTDRHRSPSAGAIYTALRESGYTTNGRGEYTRLMANSQR